jgi:hypothetical protein
MIQSRILRKPEIVGEEEDFYHLSNTHVMCHAAVGERVRALVITVAVYLGVPHVNQHDLRGDFKDFVGANPLPIHAEWVFGGDQFAAAHVGNWTHIRTVTNRFDTPDRPNSRSHLVIRSQLTKRDVAALRLYFGVAAETRSPAAA